MQLNHADSGEPKTQGIHWPIFFSSVGMLIILVVPLALFPAQGRQLLGVAYTYLTENLGFVYILTGIGALLLLLYLAFGPHKSIVFARTNSPPRFSTLSWSAMLFCGGIGTSVLYWGMVEWAHYYANPPFSVAPQTRQALYWATSYPIFHWGLIGWAFYCLPGVAMGYAYYVKGADSLRLSEACAGIVPSSMRPLVAPLIDLIFVVGLVGACSTGIGLAVPLISTLVSELLGLQRASLGFTLDVIVITTITILFAASAWLGLERGIKRLSNINIVLSFLLLVFILVVGPTLFIIELGLETIGHQLSHFITMSTAMDAVTGPQPGGSFVEAWTVFYWAWWLALGPFMGVFIARISQGRTMQQVILGCLGYGTLGCTVFFVVLGNYAVWLQLGGLVDVLGLIDSEGAPQAIVAVLQSLPAAELIIAVFAVVCVIFAATSYDSASYTLAMTATRNLDETIHPGRLHRVFWAFLLGLLPITLIQMGGLRPLQSAVILASVPLLLVFLIMAWVLWQSLRSARICPKNYT